MKKVTAESMMMDTEDVVSSTFTTLLSFAFNA